MFLHLPYLLFCHSACPCAYPALHLPSRFISTQYINTMFTIPCCSKASCSTHTWWCLHELVVYHDLPHQSTSCEVEIALKIKRVAVLDKQFTEYKLAGSAKRIPAQRLDSRPSKWDLRTTLAANPALSARRLHLPPWKYRDAWRKRLFSLSESLNWPQTRGRQNRFLHVHVNLESCAFGVTYFKTRSLWTYPDSIVSIVWWKHHLRTDCLRLMHHILNYEKDGCS